MDKQTCPAQLHVVIDDGNQNRLLYGQLIGLGLHAHLLPATADLSCLRTLVEQEGDSRALEALHLYAHGQPGQLQLGRSPVETAQLAEQSEAWRAIGRQLRPGGDLLLYGCDLARHASGRDLLNGLAGATHEAGAAGRQRHARAEQRDHQQQAGQRQPVAAHGQWQSTACERRVVRGFQPGSQGW
ncbi:MAG: DUF4347 domain-containing protein [Vulcanococcus sp.]